MRFEILEEDPGAMQGAATLRRVAIHSRQGPREHCFELVLFLPNITRAPAGVFLLINNRAESNTDPTRKQRSGFWPAEQIIARGYAAASFHYAELAPDDPEHFREGVINLFEGGPTSRPATTLSDAAVTGPAVAATGPGNVTREPAGETIKPGVSTTEPATVDVRIKADPAGAATRDERAESPSSQSTRYPSTAQLSGAGTASPESTTAPGRPDDAWGALAAWGWGASRAMDYFQTEPRIDARREGGALGRRGRPALCDDRFQWLRLRRGRDQPPSLWRNASHH
jgi:hypothetical protein